MSLLLVLSKGIVFLRDYGPNPIQFFNTNAAAIQPQWKLTNIPFPWITVSYIQECSPNFNFFFLLFHWREQDFHALSTVSLIFTCFLQQLSAMVSKTEVPVLSNFPILLPSADAAAMQFPRQRNKCSLTLRKSLWLPSYPPVKVWLHQSGGEGLISCPKTGGTFVVLVAFHLLVWYTSLQ